VRVPCSRTGVLVLAATNRPEVLDPALLRPGRISRRVVVPRPSQEGRRDILTVHLRHVPVDGDLRLVRIPSPATFFFSKIFERFPVEDMIQASAGGGLQLAGDVASVSQGFAGADLANVVNEAALLAARRGKGARPVSTVPQKAQLT
jgi:ATP-dependent Zn protease